MNPYTTHNPAPPWVALALAIVESANGLTAREIHERALLTDAASNLHRWGERMLRLYRRGYVVRTGKRSGHPGDGGLYTRTELRAPTPAETADRPGRVPLPKPASTYAAPVQLPPDETLYVENVQHTENRADRVCRAARKPIRRGELVAASGLDTYCAHEVIDVCTRTGRLRLDGTHYTATGDDVMPSAEQIAGYP